MFDFIRTKMMLRHAIDKFRKEWKEIQEQDA